MKISLSVDGGHAYPRLGKSLDLAGDSVVHYHVQMVTGGAPYFTR